MTRIPIVVKGPLDRPDNFEGIIDSAVRDAQGRDYCLCLIPGSSKPPSIPIVYSGEPTTPEHEQVIAESVRYAKARTR